jgi:hypothetical protein
VSLGVEREDEAEFKRNPATVSRHIFPVDGVEGKWVNIGGEEATQLSENLLDTDTHGSLSVWKEFDKVGCI